MTGATRRPTAELLAIIDKLVNDAMTGPPDMKLLPYISALSEAAVCIRAWSNPESTTR